MVCGVESQVRLGVMLFIEQVRNQGSGNAQPFALGIPKTQQPVALHKLPRELLCAPHFRDCGIHAIAQCGRQPYSASELCLSGGNPVPMCREPFGKNLEGPCEIERGRRREGLGLSRVLI